MRVCNFWVESRRASKVVVVWFELAPGATYRHCLATGTAPEPAAV